MMRMERWQEVRKRSKSSLSVYDGHELTEFTTAKLDKDYTEIGLMHD